MSRSLEINRRRAVWSGVFVALLFLLCGVLGFLQYRWIGEVSDAARERLRGSLQASLGRFSREFNQELSAAIFTLVPATSADNLQAAESSLTAHYADWRKEQRREHIFAAIGLAVPKGDSTTLEMLDLNAATLHPADWPASWSALHNRLNSYAAGDRRGGPDGSADNGLVFELPLFRDGGGGFPGAMGRGGGRGFGPPRNFGPPAPPEAPFPRREVAWVIVELNLPYIRETILPELLQRDLADYQVEILSKTRPPEIVYRSETDGSRRVSTNPDASASFFAPQFAMGGRGMGRGGPGPGPSPINGRWEIFVRHRAGSLETVVASLRRRDLALTVGVLLLMVASVLALIRFTRSAQKLAELQINFVAGISHELRTPLTIIHTAGYNLRGKMAHNPTQVEKYGALIQQESGRLTTLVEQIMRFAGAEAGRVIQEPEPLSVESVIQDALESSKAVMGAGHYAIEQKIEEGLPLISGDPTALRHALQNLLANAAKYGTRDSNWIGVFASRATEKGKPVVEIRVADHGPGIPEEEQKHIFDPFFRGQQAVDDQVHGTGLGLNLVKKIIQAHGGTIRVKSEPMKGAEFIVRLPEAPWVRAGANPSTPISGVPA